MSHLAALIPRQQKTFWLLLIFLSGFSFLASTLITFRLLHRVIQVEVPELTQKSVESARSILRVKRLRMEIAEFRFDERTPINMILSQDLPAGTKTKSGRIIKVVVSRGTRSVMVPEVRNKSVREATLVLEPEGFQLGRITRYYTDEAQKNIVLDQQPSAGEIASRGLRINLLISQGPWPVWYIMPNLIGWPMDAASRILDSLGMELMEIKRKLNDEKPTGTVIEQTPKPGVRIQNGDPAGFVATVQTADQQQTTRFVTIKYQVPPGSQEVRIKMVVRDDTGLHEIYNAMEKPNALLTLRRTLQGTNAILRIYINGVFAEEQNI